MEKSKSSYPINPRNMISERTRLERVSVMSMTMCFALLIYPALNIHSDGEFLLNLNTEMNTMLTVLIALC
ncbi:hypothetical protein P8452_55969 [Trifolium repens]|nr:hypothetical protein P8452_55969 [Trifolium repens]